MLPSRLRIRWFRASPAPGCAQPVARPAPHGRPPGRRTTVRWDCRSSRRGRLGGQANGLGGICSRGLAVAALLLAVSVAQAQGASGRAERADPLDPEARVPAVRYLSPLAGHRRLGDDLRVPWREANETVNRIGGWRAYAREARRPDPAAPAPGAGAAAGQGGHETHRGTR